MQDEQWRCVSGNVDKLSETATSVLLHRQVACVTGQPCFLDVKQFSCLCTMTHELPQWIISLHVFGEDTVANVTVYKANLCGRFLLGTAPFFVASLFWFAAKRKSGWGICGSLLVFGVFVCFLLFGAMLICHFHGPNVSLYKTAFHCLRNCKDRA